MCDESDPLVAAARLSSRRIRGSTKTGASACVLCPAKETSRWEEEGARAVTPFQRPPCAALGSGSSAGRCRSATALQRGGLIIERPRVLPSLRQFGIHG